jgi:hypothetical protein
MEFNFPLIRKISFSVITVILFIGCSESQKEKTPWVDLFDGQTLNGWTIKGGQANYDIKEGAIVGTSVPNSTNTFLTTDKMYGDFILELDYIVDSTMNSGIQIRSNSFPNYMDGRVHGYQIEIDPSNRAWSAGIYDEARRGWFPLWTTRPHKKLSNKTIGTTIVSKLSKTQLKLGSTMYQQLI